MSSIPRTEYDTTTHLVPHGLGPSALTVHVDSSGHFIADDTRVPPIEREHEECFNEVLD